LIIKKIEIDFILYFYYTTADKMTTSSAYYKGTPIQMLISIEDAMEHAQEMIDKGLALGMSIESQKKDYKEQLDNLEQELVDTFGDTHYTIRDILRIWENDLPKLSIWYLDIAALLIMKEIKNDNENGFFTMDDELLFKAGYKSKQMFNTCVVCAKKGAWKKCSTCKKDYYCGKECQKTDWKRHKATH
jgi:hypothetical protein